MSDYPFNMFTDYFVRENHIDTTKRYEIDSVPARSLIFPNRFDLMAKLIYINAREKGCDMKFAESVYRDNINAFSCGNFTEYGSKTKKTFQKYLDEFDDIIDDIKNNGFNSEKSLIPVGGGDILCDGAHRVAAAAYYNKNVSIIRFPQLTRRYNYEYFRRFLMSGINMGYMATMYAKTMSDCYMACLWPVSRRKKIHDVTDLICKYGEIIYSQDVYLTYKGIKNFMVNCYGHQAWAGNINNHFSGVEACASGCYDSRYPVTTYLFQCKNFNHVLQLKQEIRGMFGLDSHSMYISDNSAETLMTTRLLYNPNSVHVLNNAEMFKYDMVFKRVNELKTLIASNNKDVDRFIIDSSSVLEVCGLRQSRDVDYTTDYTDGNLTESIEGIDYHDSQPPFHSISVKEMLYNPESHFYFNGMKFLSVEKLLEMKQKRNEPKDRKDVKLLKGLIKNFDKVPAQYSYSTIKHLNHRLIKYKLYGLGNESYSMLRLHLLIHKIAMYFPFSKYPYFATLKILRVLNWRSQNHSHYK